MLLRRLLHLSTSSHHYHLQPSTTSAKSPPTLPLGVHSPNHHPHKTLSTQSINTSAKHVPKPWTHAQLGRLLRASPAHRGEPAVTQLYTSLNIRLNICPLTRSITCQGKHWVFKHPFVRPSWSNIAFQADSACYMAEPHHYYRYDLDLEESDDEDVGSQRKRMALRKAASMEVLKAYGGCFASGFLALQEPLPSRPQSKLRRYESTDEFDIRRTASIATSLESASMSCTSSTTTDSPRPDSATLSAALLQEAAKASKWSWRSMRRSRKNASKKP